jgi:putative ABC transport system permease protein
MLSALLAAALLQSIDSTPPRRAPRSVAVDERLAADAGIRIGQSLILSASPGAAGDTALVAAIVRRSADPAEVARGEFRVRMHLDQLQRLTGYGDRVDRFAVATRDARAADSALAAINAAAFGFRAHLSRDVAVETSKTFLVVTRFHRAIGLITIVASTIFLLCIMLLKVEERRRDVAALRLTGISAATIVQSVMVESALIAILGSGVGVAIAWVATVFINWHYRGVYRTPLVFALITPEIIVLAIGLSVALGLAAGFFASLRLVRTEPLLLLTGRGRG